MHHGWPIFPDRPWRPVEVAGQRSIGHCSLLTCSASAVEPSRHKRGLSNHAVPWLLHISKIHTPRSPLCSLWPSSSNPGPAQFGQFGCSTYLSLRTQTPLSHRSAHPVLVDPASRSCPLLTPLQRQEETAATDWTSFPSFLLLAADSCQVEEERGREK